MINGASHPAGARKTGARRNKSEEYSNLQGLKQTYWAAGVENGKGHIGEKGVCTHFEDRPGTLARKKPRKHRSQVLHIA